MIDFDDVSGQTWRTIELILSAPPLLDECLRVLEAHQAVDAMSKTAEEAIEQLLRDVDDNAQLEERPRALDALAACRPLRSVQWTFVSEALRAVLASTITDLDWTEAIEQMFAD